MAHAIKRLNGSVIWFDAVTSSSKDYSGQATSHPIEDGSNISDFVIVNNPRFSIQGVITDADFNTSRPNGETAEVNNSPVTSEDNVVITASTTSPLISLLPESVLGLLQKEEIPIVVIEKTKAATQKIIEDALTEIQRTGEPFELLSFNNGVMDSRPLTTCILTQLSFSESPDGGDALYPQMTFEQLKFVTLRRGTTPKFKTNKALEDQASGLAQTAGRAGSTTEVPVDMDTAASGGGTGFLKDSILKQVKDGILK